jgi:ribosomal protein L34E
LSGSGSYEERLAIVQDSLARLQQRIAEQCGPEHRYVDHHDEKLPWCPHCRVTDAGLPLSAYGFRRGRPAELRKPAKHSED